MVLMLVLAGAGIVLLLAAPLLGRLIAGKRGDPGGATRILQAVAVVLLVAALIFRPHQDETAAFPPPPDAARDR